MEQNIDKDWFQQKLKEAGKTQNGLARHLGKDHSTISRLFKGDWRMTMDEAKAIASFMAAPLAEVLRHARVNDKDTQVHFLLAATINETGQVERITEPRSLPQAVIDRISTAVNTREGHMIAAQIRALNGPLAVMDDAVVLFAHTDVVEADAIGVLSICRNFAGDQIMAKIERARKTDEARVITVDGQVREFDLQTATPVLAVIP